MPKLRKLEDYRAPEYQVESVDLNVNILEAKTVVECTLKIMPLQSQIKDGQVRLFGKNIDLKSIQVNNVSLSQNEYVQDEDGLLIPLQATPFEVTTRSEIYPEKNDSLEGLYRAGDILCTQCEAEGFRRITFYPDRPDILSIFKVRIEADESMYPILLSNGNLIERGQSSEGRHFAVFHDPFKKPSYLFALVAGKLEVLKDTFSTRSGRNVKLEIYASEANIAKCAHAMESLKKSMKWDEDRFRLECDLDEYKIVAADRFNSGAMENKGLNIFNSQFVLADPETATDSDYRNVEGVIAHEYFHNWTGNRVTLSDWFELTLKEGLTVFRDQEFSSDVGSRDLKRIADVRIIKEYQFSEDAGPNAHPIRPISYMEPRNFYTVTVYDKGAEVIRMIHTLIGESLFQKGMDLYFQKFDGMAVTTHDFVSVMEEASGRDLSQFKLWYSQAGTPLLTMQHEYQDGTLTLTFEQGMRDKERFGTNSPFHIPIKVGFLGSNGNSVRPTESNSNSTDDYLMEMTQDKQSFQFHGFSERPTPSVLRSFSAPVALKTDLNQNQLATLMALDSDPVNRYESSRELIGAELKDAYEKGVSTPSNIIIRAFKQLISDPSTDPMLKAEIMTIPSVDTICSELPHHDALGVYDVREQFLNRLATAIDAELESVWKKRKSVPYQPISEQMSQRAFENACLSYLMRSSNGSYADQVYEYFVSADNMTNRMAALGILCRHGGSTGLKASEIFKKQFRNNQLAMDKWFAVRMGTSQASNLDLVCELASDELFDIKNPNRVRALFGSFARNVKIFHAKDGSGYEYFANRLIEIDRFNPSIAARLATLFDKTHRLLPEAKNLSIEILTRVIRNNKPSNDLSEIIDKVLQCDPKK